MTTVNFQCGHCHNLMAVGQEFLGQQVRCPHCQQVVLAPPPPPPSVDLPTIEVPQREEHESIFTPPEGLGDDLFGEEAASPPRVELPTEPAFPQIALDDRTLPTDGGQVLPRPFGADEPTLTYTGSEMSPLPSGIEVSPALATEPAGVPGPFGTTEEAPAAPPEEGLPSLRVQPKPRPSRSSGWIIAILIVPLISYSILATVAIIMLMTQLRNAPHPLEIMPDLEGDNKGDAKRGGKRSSVDIKQTDPEQPLPAKLRAALGRTLAIGDLEVTPLAVERKPIVIKVGNYAPEAPEEALVLWLRLRNRSSDVTFKPMDRFFARVRPQNASALKQYTILEMGTRKFYGGPLEWAPLKETTGPRSSKNYEAIVGQLVNEELKPGDEMKTFVCTNPKDPVLKALDTYQGPLLWRVQLRRGVVKWTTKDGVDREDSATAVVGVEFTAADVKQGAE